jgi:hypothetical protein
MLFVPDRKMCFYTDVFGYCERQEIMLLNTVSRKQTNFLQFCFPSMKFWTTLQFLILCPTGFEVRTVVVIHCATRGVLDVSQWAMPATVVCTHATWGGVHVAIEFPIHFWSMANDRYVVSGLHKRLISML